MALLDATSTADHTFWFRLDRHEDAPSGDDTGTDDTTESGAAADDDEEAEHLLADAADDGTEPEPEPDGNEEPEGADQLGDKGKKALDAMKAQRAAARKEAAAAKRQLAELTRKVQEFEDRDKSELEKATAKAERLAGEAAKATARAVKAEVKALATGQFADVTDAQDSLMRDPSKYVDASGEIDEDAIRADLDELLERKPHWRVPEPATAPAGDGKKTLGRPKPKPDPGQGGRGEKPVDYRTAPREQVDAELAKYGVHLRR
jgi:hypothetical protein